MTQKPENALGELRRAVWAVPDADTEARRRVHIAARVLELQRELSARSERRRRYGFGFAAAALLFGGIMAFVFIDSAPPRPTAALVPEDRAVRLVSGHASRRDGQSLTAIGPGLVALTEDPILVTHAEESAEFRLASNTALSVAPSSELGLLRHEPTAGGFDERVRLHAGSVALSVPKLGQRETLAVETRDASVYRRRSRVTWEERRWWCHRSWCGTSVLHRRARLFRPSGPPAGAGGYGRRSRLRR